MTTMNEPTLDNLRKKIKKTAERHGHSLRGWEIFRQTNTIISVSACEACGGYLEVRSLAGASKPDIQGEFLEKQCR